MSNRKPAEDRFYLVSTELGDYITELIKQSNKLGFNTISHIIADLSAQVILDKNPSELIHTFFINSYHYWQLIENKDSDFILFYIQNIYTDVPMEEIQPLQELWKTISEVGDKYINEEDREYCWDYFQAMVSICKSYIKENPAGRLYIFRELTRRVKIQTNLGDLSEPSNSLPLEGPYSDLWLPYIEDLS